ncbi:MAG: tight adherence protein [Pseudomonadota bacterium]|nr:tight adherence protein [Pseudomonadota bacterium]
MDLTFVLFSLLAFLSVVLGLEGLYNLWASQRSPEARRIASRLTSLAGELETPTSRIERIERVSRLPALERLLRATPLGRRLERHVRTGGGGQAASELLAISAALGGVGLLGTALSGRGLLAGLLLGAALAALPWMQVARQRRRRILRLETQFPEALDLMGRALRAGHALPVAVRLCGDELAAPLGAEFALLADELQYGVPFDQALHHLAERVPLDDIGYFTAAVLIQREAGGNLAELIDNIAALVRQRMKLHGQVRTLSAEGRLSALILTLLPFGVGLMVHLISPDFMQVLWTEPAGQKLSGAALVLIVIGQLWMRRVVRLRF